MQVFMFNLVLLLSCVLTYISVEFPMRFLRASFHLAQLNIKKQNGAGMKKNRLISICNQQFLKLILYILTEVWTV